MVEVNDQPEVCSDTLLLLEQMRCLSAIIGQDLREHCQLTLDEYCIAVSVAEKPLMQKVLAYDLGGDLPRVEISVLTRVEKNMSRFVG